MDRPEGALVEVYYASRNDSVWRNATMDLLAESTVGVSGFMFGRLNAALNFVPEEVKLPISKNTAYWLGCAGLPPRELHADDPADLLRALHKKCGFAWPLGERWKCWRTPAPGFMLLHGALLMTRRKRKRRRTR